MHSFGLLYNTLLLYLSLFLPLSWAVAPSVASTLHADVHVEAVWVRGEAWSVLMCMVLCLSVCPGDERRAGAALLAAGAVTR